MVVSTCHPNARLLSLRFLDGSEYACERGNDILISVGVFSEEILEHHDRFARHMRDAQFEEGQQVFDALFGCFTQTDRDATDRTNGETTDVGVDVTNVLNTKEENTESENTARTR